MDIIAFSTQLEERMRANLIIVNDQNANPEINKSKIAAQNLAVIRNSLYDLRQYVCSHQFNSVEEEIKFFKEVKPIFVSLYLHYKVVNSVYLVEPYLNENERNKYLISITKSMFRYTKLHRAFHQYSASGATSRDEKYYTRSSNTNPRKDQLFTTARSETLATLLSHQLTLKFLSEALPDKTTTFQSKLTWTGKKTDLVELLFALHSAGSFNNGEIEVKQMAKAFEQSFNVLLGNHYDYLQKMRSRKSGQITFIERLKMSLRSRLEGLDMNA